MADNLLTRCVLAPVGYHSDERRHIADLHVRKPSFRDMTQVSILSSHSEGATVGNHYHQQKDELFYVIGVAQVFLKDMDTGESTQFHIDDGMGRMIYVPRNVAHTFLLTMNSHLVICTYHIGEVEEHDTFPHKLV